MKSGPRQRLSALGLRASKGLGQHFLVDRSVLRRIVAAAEITPDDTVVEVGPGLGTLTAELAKMAGKTVAVEIDAGLASALAEQFSSDDSVTIITGDMLALDPADLLGRHERDGRGGARYKVVANLPYYVASPIVRRFLEGSHKPGLMVVMVQKEVGESMAATPGHMSLVSVGVQFYGRARIVAPVPARCFYPRPKVDSAVVRIDVYPEAPFDVGDIEGFFHVVRAGFSAPRKQLRNSLSQGLDVDGPAAAGFLSRAGIDATRRAQTLSIEEWVRLYHAMEERGRR